MRLFGTEHDVDAVRFSTAWLDPVGNVPWIRSAQFSDTELFEVIEERIGSCQRIVEQRVVVDDDARPACAAGKGFTRVGFPEGERLRG